LAEAAAAAAAVPGLAFTVLDEELTGLLSLGLLEG
jgi:hypothetical protein